MYPTHAHVCLARLGGVNHRVPVTYRGASVYVPNPQADSEGRPGHKFRLDAGRFIAGEGQSRDGWSIKKWDEVAQRVTENEANWQT